MLALLTHVTSVSIDCSREMLQLISPHIILLDDCGSLKVPTHLTFKIQLFIVIILIIQLDNHPNFAAKIINFAIISVIL